MPNHSKSPDPGMLKAIRAALPGRRDAVVKRAMVGSGYRKTELDLFLSQLLWSGHVKYKTDTQEFYA